jgi:hypothetical protein
MACPRLDLKAGGVPFCLPCERRVRFAKASFDVKISFRRGRISRDDFLQFVCGQPLAVDASVSPSRAPHRGLSSQRLQPIIWNCSMRRLKATGKR